MLSLLTVEFLQFATLSVRRLRQGSAQLIGLQDVMTHTRNSKTKYGVHYFLLLAFGIRCRLFSGVRLPENAKPLATDEWLTGFANVQEAGNRSQTLLPPDILDNPLLRAHYR